MLQFLLDIVNQLYHMDVKDSIVFNGKRILSAIVIICCFHEMTPQHIKRLEDIPSDHISALLSLLCLKPDMQRQECNDWNYLITFIPSSFRKTVSDAILALIVHLSHTKYFELPEWLFAIPIVHFLRSISKPFQEIETEPNRIPWGDKLIGLQTVKSYVNDRSDVW